MILIDQIKKDRIDAMKAGDKTKRSILSLLIGDIENRFTGHQKPSDGDVVALIKKYISNNEQTLDQMTNHDSDFGEEANILEKELSVLNGYLPKQLTHIEIYNIMKDVEDKSIGSLMKYMKDNYPGQYDGKTASETAKEWNR